MRLRSDGDLLGREVAVESPLSRPRLDRLRAGRLDESDDGRVGAHDRLEKRGSRRRRGIAKFQFVRRSSLTSVRVRHVTRSSASGARWNAGGCGGLQAWP